MLKSPATTDALMEALDGLTSPTAKHQALQHYLNEKGSTRSRVQNRVIAALPTFMYVSAYDRMDGAIQIEETQERIRNQEIEFDEHRGARLFVDFLDYAGVAIDEITKVSTYETFNAMLQAASTNITEQILEYWSQNPDLDVEVKIRRSTAWRSGGHSTEEPSRELASKTTYTRSIRPSRREAPGFVWFFSFLVKFTSGEAHRQSRHPALG